MAFRRVGILMTGTVAGASLFAAACDAENVAPSTEQNRDLNAAERMLDEAPNSLAGIDDRELLTQESANRDEGQE